MKNYSIWFYDEVYRANWLFFIGDRDNFFDFLEKNYEDKINLEEIRETWSDAGCHTWDIINFGIVIWMPKFTLTPTWLGVLMHEIIHGVIFVFDHKPINITTENHEHFTYYAESIIRRFLELRKSANKKGVKR
jgi:hypothetical protein